MKKSINYFAGIVILLFLLLNSYNISVSLLNFPIADDYEAFVDFTNSYLNANTLFEKLLLIFSQHNEHRIATLRIIEITYYHVFGNINLQDFRLIGFGFLLASLYYLFRVGKFQISELIYFVPVPLILITYVYSEIYYLAMESLSHLPMVFFTIATFHSLINKRSIFLSIVFMFFGLFSNGNGILLIPLVFLGLIMLKEYKKLIYVALFSTVFSLIYFTNYRVGELEIGLNLIPYLLKVYPIYLGGIGGFGSLKLNLIIGLVAILAFCYLLFVKKIYKTELSLTLMLSFFFLTFVIISIKRNEYDMLLLQRGAYMINSVMIYVLLYVSFYKVFIKAWLDSKKLYLAHSSIGLILIVAMVYQYINNSIWIHMFYFQQNDVKKQLVNFVGNRSDIYSDNGEIYNTVLVSKERLNTLIELDAYDVKRIKRKVVAQPFSIENIKQKGELKNEVVLSEIHGKYIVENPYLTISGKIKDITKTLNLAFGVVCESNDGQKQYFICHPQKKMIYLKKTDRSNEFEFDILIEKKHLKWKSVKISVFQVRGNEMLISPKFKTYDLNLKPFDRDIVANLVAFSSDIAQRDTTNEVSLVEVFEKDGTHKIIIDLPEPIMASSNTNFLGFANGDDIKFKAKLEHFNQDTLSNMAYCKLDKSDMEKFLTKKDNVFKLVYINKKEPTFTYSPINAVYYFKSSNYQY